MNREIYPAIADVYNRTLYRMGRDRLRPVFVQGTVVKILRDSGLQFAITDWGYILFQSSPEASRLDDVLIPVVRTEFGERALYYFLPNRWTFFELIA